MGIREPFIVRWPGHAPEGKTDTITVLSAVDLFPTVCAMTGTESRGVQPGSSSLPHFDGKNMSAALLGEPQTLARLLFWEYGRNPDSFPFPDKKGGPKTDRSPNVAVREGPWKLLLNADGSGTELYNLAEDPREMKSLAVERADVSQRLREVALAWRKSLP